VSDRPRLSVLYPGVINQTVKTVQHNQRLLYRSYDLHPLAQVSGQGVRFTAI